ncbi:Ig-like domain-containing protein [Shewanella gaetbuli]
MQKNVLIKLIYFTLVVFFLTACDSGPSRINTDVAPEPVPAPEPTPEPAPEPDEEPTIEPVILLPFTAKINKTQTITLDVSNYVNPSEAWELSSVTDNSGLTSNISFDNSTITFTGAYTGLATINWQVTHGSDTLTSTLLVAIQDPNNPAPVTTKLATIKLLASETRTVDLTDYIDNPDNKNLELISFNQNDDRFDQQGMKVTYSPNGYQGYETAIYGIKDQDGNIAIGQISVVSNTTTQAGTSINAIEHSTSLHQGETVTYQLSDLVSSVNGVSLNRLVGASNRAKITDNSIIYQPGNFIGSDEFVYVVSNESGGVDQAKIHINVTENLTSVESSLSVSPLIFNVLVGDTASFDISSAITADDDWALTQAASQGSNVAVDSIVSPTINITALTPGIEQIDYTVTSNEKAYQGAITVIINDTNNIAPEAKTVTLTTDNQTAISVDLSGQISDADGDTVAVNKLVQDGDKFTLANNTVTYTPAGYIGASSAVYVVEDSRGAFNAGLIIVDSIDPTSPNNAPTAKDYVQATDDQTTVSVDLSALNLITDADSDPLSVSLFGHSRATLSGKVIQYVPNGFYGVDDVVYRVTDGQGGSAIGKITFIVSSTAVQNNHPVANALTVDLSMKTVTAQPDQMIDISSLVSDIDGDSLQLTQVYSSQNLSVIYSAMTIKYTMSQLLDQDKIVYVVEDGKGGVAHNEIIINLVNAAPTAMAISQTIDPFDTTTPSLTIDLTSAIADADGDALSLTSLGTVAAPATLSQNGFILTYTPNGEERTEAINYTVSDGHKSASNVISIVSASQGMLSANDVMTTAMDMDAAPLTIDLSSYVANSSGRDIFISKVYGSTLGTTVASTTDLTLVYTSNNTSFGTDTFFYEITDNEGHFAQAQITVTLNEPAAPVITDLKLSYFSGTATATVTCSDCDTNRTDYQFEVSSVPVGTNSNTYQLTGNDKSNEIGVLVTVKNQYCTAQNTGISNGNACKFVQAKSVIQPVYITNITGNTKAFAALKSDGTTVTWGDSAYGGDSSAVAHALVNVKEITNTDSAFAARRVDGSVVTWGDNTAGADSAYVQAQLVNVVKVVGSAAAFSALKTDGSVVTWGNTLNGADSSAVAAQLTNITAITATDSAFAALKSDGTVVTWGDTANGGESTSVQAQLVNVKSVASTSTAFAALKGDGTVVTWGDTARGGDSSGVQAQLTNVKSITGNDYAFAALKSDGNTVVWGDTTQGGTVTVNNSAPVVRSLNRVTTSNTISSNNINTADIISIAATQSAFAALKSDGTVITWGDARYGGDSSSVQSLLTDIVTIIGNAYAFAAIKADGTVITWGQLVSGGDSSAISNELIDVEGVFAGSTAFAAILDNGEIITWGNPADGGDSSGLDDEFYESTPVFSDCCAAPTPPPANNAPVFDAVVDFTSFSGSNFSYQILASDVDGDSLSYELVNAPLWMNVDATTGEISGYLVKADVGSYAFKVLISDGTDIVESVGRYVGVNPNSAPTIDAVIEMIVEVGQPFSHQVMASDVDNDTLTYALVGAPQWMTIDSATGEITGTMTTGDFGDYSFTVTVSDDDVTTQDMGELSSLIRTNYQGNKFIELQAEYTTPVLSEVTANVQSTQTMPFTEYVAYNDYTLELQNGVITLANGTFTPIESLIVYINGEDTPTKLTFSPVIDPYTSANLTIPGLISIEKVVDYNQKLLYLPVVRLENWSYSCDGVDACYTSPNIGAERTTFERTLSYIHDFSNQVDYMEEMKSLFATECLINNSYTECATYENDLITQGTTNLEIPYWYRQLLTIGLEGHALRTAVMRDFYAAEGVGGGARARLTDYYASSGGWGSIYHEYVNDSLSKYRPVPIKTLYHEFAHGNGYGHSSGMTYGWSDYLSDIYMPSRGVDYYQSPHFRVPEIVIDAEFEKAEKTVHLSFVKEGDYNADLNVQIVHDNDLTNDPLDFDVIKGSNKLNQLSIKFNTLPYSPIYIRAWDNSGEYVSTVKYDVLDIIPNLVELTYETGGYRYSVMHSDTVSENSDLYSLEAKCLRMGATLALRADYIVLRDYLVANNLLNELPHDKYITNDRPGGYADQRLIITFIPNYASAWIGASELMGTDKGYMCIEQINP